MSIAVENQDAPSDVWDRRATVLRELALRYGLPNYRLRTLEGRERELRQAGRECFGLTEWLDNLPGYRPGPGAAATAAAEMHGYLAMMLISDDEHRSHEAQYLLDDIKRRKEFEMQIDLARKLLDNQKNKIYLSITKDEFDIIVMALSEWSAPKESDGGAEKLCAELSERVVESLDLVPKLMSAVSYLKSYDPGDEQGRNDLATGIRQLLERLGARGDDLALRGATW